MPEKICGYCNQPCEGLASVYKDGITTWYHHGEDDTMEDIILGKIAPSCYMLAQGR